MCVKQGCQELCNVQDAARFVYFEHVDIVWHSILAKEAFFTFVLKCCCMFRYTECTRTLPLKFPCMLK